MLFVLIAVVLWPETHIRCWTFGELNICQMIYLSCLASWAQQSHIFLFFHILCLMVLFSNYIKKCANKMEMLVIFSIGCFSLYTVRLFPPVSNGAMAARSQSSVGCRALRVGVPCSTFQLLLILCGRLLDAQGQGKNIIFSTLFLLAPVARQRACIVPLLGFFPQIVATHASHLFIYLFSLLHCSARTMLLMDSFLWNVGYVLGRADTVSWSSPVIIID